MGAVGGGKGGIGGSVGGGKGGIGGGVSGGKGGSVGGGKGGIGGVVGGGKGGIGNVVGGVNQGVGGSVGGGKQGVGSVVGGVGQSQTGGGAAGGKKGSPLNTLEVGGNHALSQLPPAAQAWARIQARAIASKGQFSAADHERLAHQAHATFPGVNLGVLLAVIRFLALQISAGGNLNRLYSSKKPTTLQQQLLAGG